MSSVVMHHDKSFFLSLKRQIKVSSRCFEIIDRRKFCVRKETKRKKLQANKELN